MQLIRFGAKGREKPGILAADGSRRDLSAEFRDWDSTFFAAGGLRHLQEALQQTPQKQRPEVPSKERWGAPVARAGKVVCIGLNYIDHAQEANLPVPAEPVLFLKAPNTMAGPYDDIWIPRGSCKTDWELELGIVIGATARYLESGEAAMGCIAGYCISNDVSERAFQMERGGQWTKGKSCDTFNPLGPWLATADEIADAKQLRMSLRVNGVAKQNGSTSNMIFDVGELVRYVSQFMTLEAGDLISTGTPAGVGFGMKPPQYLKVGDLLEAEIEGLGSQRQRCVAAPSAADRDFS
jgi:2-keto-4-pentenoate hydratase/2-oxohepta-3-ene-1,7-dioic acid hydratase in catechol pathway